MNYRAGQNVCALLGCHQNEEKVRETGNLGHGEAWQSGWLVIYGSVRCGLDECMNVCRGGRAMGGVCVWVSFWALSWRHPSPQRLTHTRQLNSRFYILEAHSHTPRHTHTETHTHPYLHTHLAAHNQRVCSYIIRLPLRLCVAPSQNGIMSRFSYAAAAYATY